jgi:pimeloyl-ACP methyl ester carboxylesterase
MPYAQNGDVRLYYEVMGEKGSEPVLMLAGAGRQLLDFDDGFCSEVVASGYRVIRMDNRDTGMSSAFPGRSPSLLDLYDAVISGQKPHPAYGVDDMAADAAAVLDAAGEMRAHLFGRSLGSLIAQAFALNYPQRTLSLTLAMAFSRSLVETMTPEGLARVQNSAVADEDGFAAAQVRTHLLVGSPDHLDPDLAERTARLAFRRGVHPGASARHFAVGLTAPDLRERLGALNVPTAVMHGALDRMIPLEFAHQTAQAIPGATLEVFPDMAHDAPSVHRARWLQLLLENVGRSGPKRGAPLNHTRNIAG